MKVISKILPVLFIFFGEVVYSQVDWKFVKEKKGIRVYVRDHPGRGIKEFKATVVFKNISIKEIYDLFKDGNSATKWSYSISYAQKIASPNASDDIIYYHIDAPWPMKSRDVIQYQNLRLNEHNKEVICSSYSLPDYLPRKKEFVRVEESKVYWKFNQVNNTDLSIHYQLFTDPKVPIPDNVVQYFITNGPIFVLEKLHDYLNSSKKNNGDKSQ